MTRAPESGLPGNHRAAARRGRWAAPVLAAVLAACAGTPDGRAPASAAASAGSPVPANWSAPMPAGGRAAAPEGPAFDDPLLPELVAAAQSASPSLAAAQARLQRARATRAAAGAALTPRLDALGIAVHGRQAPGAPVSTQASLGLQAAWELDLFGGAAAGRNAAQARLEAAGLALAGARTAVAAETAASYVALRACEAQRAQTQADAASRAETTRLTEASARAGFTAPADAALTRATAAQSRNQAVAQAAACDTLVKALAELTDIAEPELRRRLAARSAQVPQPVELAIPALPAELLARRPDVAEAALQVEAAAGDRAQAQAQQRPQVSLSGSLAGVTLRTAQESRSGATWSLGPLTVTFPLFDGGTRAAASAAAQAGYDEAVALYRAQVRRALREVESGLVALQSATERDADARQAAKDFEASLRATQARQQGGLASLFDLEAARRNALAAQSALIDLQRERAEAWITLYRALGGGFDPARHAAVAARP